MDMQLAIFHKTLSGKKKRGLQFIKEFHTLGNECYFPSLLEWHRGGMVLHSLKNQPFKESKAERASQRETRGTVIKCRKIHSGSRVYQDIGTVEMKNERR